MVLCSACVVPESEKPGFNGGLSQITTREISPYISFGEAKQEFEGYTGNITSAEKLPVYYILIRDVDDSGNALNWLFGVRQSTGTELLIYDRTGWKINPWNATLPSEEIMLNRVIPLGTLFIQNKDIIFNASSPSIPERRDLVLKQGIYTLTINSGSTSRILMFNATTGVLMSGHVS
ncbi:MAG: hypothetical protein Q7V05_06030 [Methanoregula sp.]|nr:hypothetical protein [Methanoregula sp.]